MRKTLATLALAAAPVLVLSACNGNAGGGSGVAALPNSGAPASQHSRFHHNDNGPQDLHAGGATFPAQAYNGASQPVGTYNHPQAPPASGSLFAHYGGVGTIYYCLTGSGFGRKEFTGQSITATQACAGLGDSPVGFGARQDPLDFVGSDVAMTEGSQTTPGDCCASYSYYAINRAATYGQPFEFPTLGGPIVFGYRPQDFPKVSIKLSTWTYCAIVNGTVNNWNDPAISADNGQSVTGGVSQTITFYYRSDGSGTTYNLTSHLYAACNPGSWPAPYNTYPYQGSGRDASFPYQATQNWPITTPSNFVGASGNPGVLAGIQSTPYGTGYVEGAYAKVANPKVSQALLQSGYNNQANEPYWVSATNKSAVSAALKHVTASAISYGTASDYPTTPGSLNSSTPWCQLFVPYSVFALPPAKTYPIVGVTYMLFYGNNQGVHLSDKTTLVNYIISKPAQNIIKSLEYAPLSSSIHGAVKAALTGTASQPSCLQ